MFLLFLLEARLEHQTSHAYFSSPEPIIKAFNMKAAEQSQPQRDQSREVLHQRQLHE